jgi:hypothetical protein
MMVIVNKSKKKKERERERERERENAEVIENNIALYFFSLPICGMMQLGMCVSCCSLVRLSLREHRMGTINLTAGYLHRALLLVQRELRQLHHAGEGELQPSKLGNTN